MARVSLASPQVSFMFVCTLPLHPPPPQPQFLSFAKPQRNKDILCVIVHFFLTTHTHSYFAVHLVIVAPTLSKTLFRKDSQHCFELTSEITLIPLNTHSHSRSRSRVTQRTQRKTPDVKEVISGTQVKRTYVVVGQGRERHRDRKDRRVA